MSKLCVDENEAQDTVLRIKINLNKVNYHMIVQHIVVLMMKNIGLFLMNQ